MREFGLSARDYPRHRSDKLMKKTSKRKVGIRRIGDMKAEYDFDYSKAKRNRFAGRISTDQTVVLLDPEVSKVFTDSESVNTALRALIAALPKSVKREARK
jgi:hypothetical protein